MEITSASSTSKSSLGGISPNEDPSMNRDIGLSLSMLGCLLAGLAGLVGLGHLPEAGLEGCEDLAESGLEDLSESGLEVGLANSGLNVSGPICIWRIVPCERSPKTRSLGTVMFTLSPVLFCCLLTPCPSLPLLLEETNITFIISYYVDISSDIYNN